VDAQGPLVEFDSARDEPVTTIALRDIVIGEKLGEGAFGVVFKAKWLNRDVAVKQVKEGAIGGDKAVSEFEGEIRHMAAMPFHENLVQLYGVTRLASGDLAAVVEFCANGTLMSALYGNGARADWTLDALLRIAHGAACGLAHLHRQEFVHRDVAARNVLLTRADEPKLGDFGMARVVAEGQYEQLTATNVGPLKWMAPEQMERRAFSKASDVFAFGVLLYEIFAREEPWQGCSNVIAATKVVNGERMDVSSPKIPVADLMMQCWAERQSERPAIADVESALRALQFNPDNID